MMKHYLLITGVMILGCSGFFSEEKSTETTGCPEGTVAYDGWSGEYPGPIFQVNKELTVDARSNVCEHKSTLKCTISPGLYHPWSEISEAGFKTVATTSRFVTLKEVDFWDVKVPKGTEIIEQFYAAEGQCGLIINGQLYQDMCPSNGDRPETFKELPNPNKDFAARQFLGVDCTEGQRAWILIDDALMKNSSISEGELLGYGEVAPTKLPDGSYPFLDKWGQRRYSQDMDLQIPESEGPFWVIAIQAGSSKKSAEKKVSELRDDGYKAHTAWLKTYGSAKNKKLWLTYVGPWSFSDRAKAEAAHEQIKFSYPKSYGVTLGRAGTRKSFR